LLKLFAPSVVESDGKAPMKIVLLTALLLAASACVYAQAETRPAAKPASKTERELIRLNRELIDALARGDKSVAAAFMPTTSCALRFRAESLPRRKYSNPSRPGSGPCEYTIHLAQILPRASSEYPHGPYSPEPGRACGRLKRPGRQRQRRSLIAYALQTPYRPAPS
jgi:hypothetical protein